MLSIFWLVLFILFVVFEIATMGLTTIWFAGGAIVSFVLSLADIHIIIQILVFLLVSLVLLFFTRPLARQYINKNTVRTNVEELVGKVVRCTETIDNYNDMGRVKINGNEWMARTIADGMTIPKDAMVQIVRIQGVKALVQPINYTNN